MSPDVMSGYQTYPALSRHHVAFVCEDALWVAPRTGGPARRLTSGTELVKNPCFSPDGQTLAFDSDFEGVPQVYVMPVEGGAPRRLTFESSVCSVVGFRPSGTIVYRSQKHAPLRYYPFLFEIGVDGVERGKLAVGRAPWVDFGDDDDQVVIGRHQLDSARWKRYRGGTTGDIRIGSLEGQDFRPLVEIEGNPVRPIRCGDRVYFIADTDGVGNLWSCDLEGQDLEQHTSGSDYYIRHLRGFESELVYQRGAQLFSFDTRSGTETILEVSAPPGGVHLQRRFISGDTSLQEVRLAPDSKSVAATVRGKFVFARAWGGPVRQPGERTGVRYRLPTWCAGGEKICVVSDAGGEEGLEVYDGKSGAFERRLEFPEIQRYESLVANPVDSLMAVTDIAGRLFLVDLGSEEAEPGLVDTGPQMRIREAAWSPDGRWLAYVTPTFWILEGGVLHLYDTESGEKHALNSDELPVHSPAFDPDGRFLYVLSERTFNPELDPVHFAAAVVEATRVYAYVLSRDDMFLRFPLA